jgi:alkylation response protein AidB-like acyl-CoA dehydrogenase
MSIGLTSEQQQLAGAVAQFAGRRAPIEATRKNFDSLAAGQLPEWWDEFVATGFHAAHLPERVGGGGGALIDAACVVEAAATALLPGPVLSTVTAGAVALLADDAPAVSTLMGRLADGAAATVVLPDGGLRAAKTADGWSVTGTSGATLGICSAQVILAGALVDDGAIWFALDPSSSATITTLRGTDLTTDIGVLHLDGHVVPPSSALAGIDTERARCVATALCASAASGTVRWCVDAVTTHLRTREQFGKPIGTFQALQHQAAMLLVNAELATAAAWDAVRAAKESLPQNQIAAAGAALMTVIPAPEVVLDALTMFGAIGFTW